MYPELTASYLTEALRNVFYRDLKKADKFQSIDSMMFELTLVPHNSNIMLQSTLIAGNSY